MGRSEKENTAMSFFEWKLIEKKAFSPVQKKDIINWIRCYIKFLDRFWELGGYSNYNYVSSKDDISGTIAFSPLNLECQYSINFNLEKFSITISLCETDAGQERIIKWKHEYDGKYFNEFEYIDKNWPLMKKNQQRGKKIAPEDIDHILEGIIAHPAIHQHIECFGLPHHVRIGNAVKNPFLFLYQLAFQLGDCFTNSRESELKKAELVRVKELIWAKIIQDKKTKTPLSAGTFFNL
ncbi:MAG: hypothetical protein A2097_14540 [Desulfobacula sp. GWF2_41_7]|nr:MAG: hypothetical protein A2097_14540 [Desulfobacula sp. GWF2_41_7]